MLQSYLHIVNISSLHPLKVASVYQVNENIFTNIFGIGAIMFRWSYVLVLANIEIVRFSTFKVIFHLAVPNFPQQKITFTSVLNFYANSQFVKSHNPNVFGKNTKWSFYPVT